MIRRDTQRQKVYTAGWAALPNNDIVGTTVKETQAYVDRVCNYAWFRRRWGGKRITVQFKRGLGGYNPAFSNVIVIGKNATGRMGRDPGASKATVLHEMAHVLTGHCDGNWHGPEFARNLLELVSFEFDAEIAEKLKIAYRLNKVKVGPAIKLREPDQVPAPRPTMKTWRVVFGDQSVQIEAANMLQVIRQLDLFSFRYRAALTSATDIRIYKSRRVST